MKVVEFSNLQSTEFFVTEMSVTSSLKGNLDSYTNLNKNYLIFTPNTKPRLMASLVYLPKGAAVMPPVFADMSLPNKKKNDNYVDCEIPYYTVIGFRIFDSSFSEITLSRGIKYIEEDGLSSVAGNVKTLSSYYASSNRVLTELDGMLSKLLLDISRIMCGEYNLNLSDTSVYPAIQYLDSDEVKRITIPQLARICDMSVTSFRVHFLKEIGITPSEYIAIHKLTKAQKLLSGGKLEVKDVANQLGFDSVSYFTKFYKLRTGRAPSDDLAKRVRKNK